MQQPWSPVGVNGPRRREASPRNLQISRFPPPQASLHKRSLQQLPPPPWKYSNSLVNVTYGNCLLHVGPLGSPPLGEFFSAAANFPAFVTLCSYSERVSQTPVLNVPVHGCALSCHVSLSLLYCNWLFVISWSEVLVCTFVNGTSNMLLYGK